MYNAIFAILQRKAMYKIVFYCEEKQCKIVYYCEEKQCTIVFCSQERKAMYNCISPWQRQLVPFHFMAKEGWWLYQDCKVFFFGNCFIGKNLPLFQENLNETFTFCKFIEDIFTLLFLFCCCCSLKNRAWSAKASKLSNSKDCNLVNFHDMIESSCIWEHDPTKYQFHLCHFHLLHFSFFSIYFMLYLIMHLRTRPKINSISKEFAQNWDNSEKKI